jgi:hypothetical protein
MKFDRYDDGWKDIWRNSQHAPPEDKWQWDHYTWMPILEKIWEGETEHLVCPVCGRESVYFKYLAVYENEIHGRLIRHGERWVGCESCGVQIHDRARIPDWLRKPEWVPRNTKSTNE